MNTARLWRGAAIGLIFITTWLTLAHLSQARAAGSWYVSPGGSDANSCTVPAAPCATLNGVLNKASATDTIYAGAGTFTGTDDLYVVNIGKPIVLSGGWDADFTRQTEFSIIDGQKQRSGLYIATGGTVTIDRFVIQNGQATGPASGGFEVFDANLIMTNCVVRDNIGMGVGGGAYIASSLTMSNCSLTGNQVFVGDGGALRVVGAANLNNVTIHDNYAPAGGALSVSGAVSINNSTITSNTAGLRSGGAIVSYYGNISMRNSILAGNIAYVYDGVKAVNQCSMEGGAFVSGGYNIVGTLNGCGFATTTGDVVNVDPKLGSLQGIPGYRPLLSGSPAINAGDPNGCKDNSYNPLPTDMRGMPRAGRCDSGAYEVGLNVTKFVSGISTGDAATFTIQLDNTEGLATLGDLALTDTLPVSMTYVPDSLIYTNGNGIESGGTITWTGSVTGSSPTTISFGVQISNPMVATNVVTVSWANAIFNASAALGSYRSFLPLVNKSQVTPPTSTCPTRYFDDFSNPASGWIIDDDGYVRMEYLNSEYRILSKQSGYLYLVRAPLACSYSNYIVEIDARWVGTPGSSYGLILSLNSDYSDYYLFDINTDSQQYRVYHRTSAGFTQVVAPTTSTAILASNATNHFKVLDNGGWLTLYLNGTLLNGMLPGSFNPAKGVGIVSSPYSNKPSSDARFDNFRLTVLPPFATSGQGTQSPTNGHYQTQARAAGKIALPLPDLSWEQP